MQLMHKGASPTRPCTPLASARYGCGLVGGTAALGNSSLAVGPRASGPGARRAGGQPDRQTRQGHS